MKKAISKQNLSYTQANLADELELYKKILQVFQIGDYYYYSTNQEGEIKFLNSDAVNVLGYNADFDKAFFNNCIHPEDAEYINSFKNEIDLFRKQLPVKKTLNYKIQYNFRYRKSDGKYIYLLHQEIPIEVTDEGKILKLLNLDIDIGYLEPENKPTLSFIGLENEPSFLGSTQEKIHLETKQQLSKMEKEILKLMIQGHSSIEISKILFKSKLTINTHRKNILTKTKSINTIDLITKAIKENWI